ncbi:MAG: trypsin-like peptidase domain-containing protein [Clostridia bacterium]|nr:trypsin-like peptidase domain-containing protein [Clostridia bacterium]
MKKQIISIILCVVMCISFMSVGVFAADARDVSHEEALAGTLKTLGLFRGVSDTNFDLGRAPTRTEALVMLIRVLGKESEALSGDGAHPFTDVPSWADKYVAYGFENGLTNGISSAKFGGEAAANSNMYLTFMLRALGYSDENGADFDWTSPFALSRSVGILPSYVNTDNFLRADVVSISYAALSAKLKGSQQTLAGKLISMGAFTESSFDAVYDASLIDSYTPAVNPSNSTPATNTVKTELTAEEIYSRCSPAVFYIEIYNASGTAIGSGSGFFIDSDGTAVTNYHVIENARSAKITLSETGRTLDVEGVYAANAAEDWAVIKISGSGFPTLSVNTETPAGGATVYAIGSPLGLQNTISQGIVSNPSRVVDGQSYIQTSAAISSGSSGGALINKYGEVIGITSGSYIDGQLLNVAVPLSYVKGYTKTSLTALAQTKTQTAPAANFSAERQKAAFGEFKSFIVKNGSASYSDDGSLVYGIHFESADDEGGVDAYLANYYPGDNDITLSMSYLTPDGEVYIVTTILYEDAQPSLFYFTYQPGLYRRVTFEGFGFYYAPALSEDYELEFYSAAGVGSNDPQTLYLNQSLANYMLVLGVEFTDYIFENYIPSYSMADFGYVSLS